MTNQTSSADEPDRTPDEEAEALIGRIIDGEATPQDCDRFEHMAAVEGRLWRRLALRQLDMALLADRVVACTDSAERVDVGGGRRRRGINLPVALSGWAAVVVIGVCWAVFASGGGGAPPGPRADPAADLPAAPALTPQEHFRKYMEAEFVVGELDPVLLDTEPLGGGRTRLRILRRIEEYAETSVSLEDLIDSNGRLRIDPAQLRGGE